ncbi:conserved oligomeric Golgi complex subunit 8 [Leptopilina heterotoma]|uniref:conserved oligomeric Golgi complex subunit 8 n=1 Tax=Leptopilina heterotoma TaxID=63436 RepID=UPI001CA9EFBD|nr:conserved oligomeric Golgi complex subunit 8 [Leptopilina heterotoma]
MDIETEKVIELVFPEGIPDSWKENPDFYQYLSKLGGFDIDQLNKEPDHLVDEKNAVLQNTQDLVFANYKTFIQTAESSREIFKQFNETENRLENLTKDIPRFIEKCQLFCDASKDINSHRRLNGLTLNRSGELLEILEMPQLMESCLRSNQYNEALEISQYARQLGTKHGDIPIVASVVAEIENSWSSMVGQVVGSLRGDLPLPRCLQLVGLLRSMDAFTEPELRIKFLQARDSWLQGLLSAIPNEDPNFHLTKTIELSRIHLFNIITQYRAMFSDQDHISLGRDISINESAIFYHWLEEKISQFLGTLEQDLPGVNSIDSILGQCTYFALSFGRVGADFTGRMSAIFVKVIGDKVEANIWRATKKFEKDMETFTLINKVQRSDVKVENVAPSENPPEQLMEFYPLAEYCNGLIATFNEFRLCSPIALSQNFTKLMQESLSCVAKAMLFFYKQEQQAFTANERENMLKFVDCLSEQLIPYVQFCIHALFPANQIATHLEISPIQSQKEGVTYLNEKLILEPLATLLPIRDIPKDSFLHEFPISETFKTKELENFPTKISLDENINLENLTITTTVSEGETITEMREERNVDMEISTDVSTKNVESILSQGENAAENADESIIKLSTTEFAEKSEN